MSMIRTSSILEEELKKGEKLPVGWPWRLLTFMIIFFLVVVSVYAGMILGYKPYLNSQIKNLDEKLADMNQSVDEQQQKDLINFYSQLVNIGDMLKSHPMPSKIFDFLESNTHQNIYYLSLNLSAAEKNAKIEGVASDYNVLTQQLELLRKVPETEAVFLEDSRINEGGGIRFMIRLLLK